MRYLFLSLLLINLLPALESNAGYRELYKEGKFSEALTELEQSPEARQKNYGYFFNRGIIHHALNQDALAVGYLSKAKALNPSSDELRAPLNDATANLVKWLGAQRLDATSYWFEIAGDFLPLDIIFISLGVLSVLAWAGFVFIKKRRGISMRVGFITLLLSVAFGLWGAWCDQHPLVITTESRLVKSGPSETFLDRGSVEAGMKLRIVGQMFETTSDASATPRKWWKIRFNEKQDLGFIPASSGLLLVDESNTPES